MLYSLFSPLNTGSIQGREMKKKHCSDILCQGEQAHLQRHRKEERERGRERVLTVEQSSERKEVEQHRVKSCSERQNSLHTSSACLFRRTRARESKKVG